MSVSITFNYPKELDKHPETKRAIENSATFIRDFWLARSPYASGAYAAGLKHSGSIKFGGGKIIVTNMATHAHIVENGHKSFNIGLKLLMHNAKVSKDGNRYKVIKIEPQGKAAFRKASVAQREATSFQKLFPVGLTKSKLSRFGSIKPFKTKKSIMRPLKQRPAKASSPRGFFIVSEKAIRENPSKWRIPSLEGRKLALNVKNETLPMITEAIKAAINLQRQQQDSRGRRAAFGRRRYSMSVVPAKRGA